MFTGKISKVKNPDQIVSDELINSEHHEQAFDYSFPQYYIKDFLDYVHIKTYLSTLDKLDQTIDGIFEKITVGQQIVTKPKQPQKDKLPLKAHHIGLLFYLTLMQYGFEKIKNNPLLFVSYFLLLLTDEPKEVVKFISNDFNISTGDQEKLINTLKIIHERTPLHPDASNFINKWYSIANEFDQREIVNLPEGKGTEIRKKTNTLRKWATITRSHGGAFNLISFSDNSWEYDDKKANEIVGLLQTTYPSLINDAFMDNFKKFEKECIQIAYNL